MIDDAVMQELDAPSTVIRDGLQITSDINYGKMRRQKLDVIRPAQPAPGAPIIIYFYGGGFRTGNKSLYTYIAEAFAQAGAVAIVPSYRLFPRVKFPEFLRDCAAAVAWVQSHAAQTGSGEMFLMGHSAGGYIATMLGLDRKWLDEAGADSARIAGVIGLAGVYDFLPFIKPKLMDIFTASAGPETQPTSFARANAPPLLLVTGSEDRVVPAHHAQALSAAVAKVGGRVQMRDYKGMTHGSMIHNLAPGSEVVRDVMGFIGETTKVTVSKKAVLF